MGKEEQHCSYFELVITFFLASLSKHNITLSAVTIPMKLD